MMYITDLHIHPTMAAFGSGPNGALPNVFLHSSIKRKITSNFLKCLIKVAPGPTKDLSSLSPESQSDFSNLAKGKCKLVGIVLGSMESGFTQINVKEHPQLRHIRKLLGKNGRARLVESISGVHFDKVRYIRDELGNKNDSPSYFTLFQKEVSYVMQHRNMTFQLGHEPYPYSIRFPQSRQELLVNLDEDNVVIGFFAIEGMQSLGIGLKSDGLEADYLTRISFAKNLGGIMLYASINHHFTNSLSGHAKTLGKTLGKMLNQQVDENRGISKDGYKVISALLDLETGGKRVLIDIKHFNLKSRREFYSWYNANYSGLNLPIICSHTGLTNKSWSSAIQNLPVWDSDDLNSKSYFHEWSVNLFKEDVWEIVKSNGLIGIQLDEKRLGGEIVWKKIIGNYGLNKDQAFAELVLANILSIVQTAYEFAQKENLNLSEILEQAWASICIGSDFDGLVNPIDNMVTSADFFEYPALLSSRFNENLEYTRNIHGWELSSAQISILLNGKKPAFRLQQILKENIPSFLSRVLPLMGY